MVYIGMMGQVGSKTLVVLKQIKLEQTFSVYLGKKID